MLWIALHLPLLSLESFVATLPGGAAKQQPVALMDAQRIVCANAAAQALGVKTGLKRATALALAPQLTLGQADPARDRLAITGVAHAALAFTPSVTLEPWGDASTAPHTVLLEVQASLRYFGGRAKLLQCLRAAMAPLGHQVVCASALTAQGAALLSRLDDAPQGLHAADLPSLGCLLHGAPVWLLEAGREHWDVLQGMGLRTCADLQRLPRSGVARRFGETLLDEFDRALGNRPDPRRWITLPDTFSSRLELFARADTTEQVLHGASLLLVRLMAWASAQHAQVRRFTLQMQRNACESRGRARSRPGAWPRDSVCRSPGNARAAPGVAAAAARSLARAPVPSAARRTCAALAVRPRANRIGLVGCSAGRARLLHRPG